MHAFFIGEVQLAGAGVEVVVGGEEGRHGVLVKRVRVGEEVMVIDGRGLKGIGVVQEVFAGKHTRDGGRVVVRVERVEREERGQVEVVVASCVPKGDLVSQMIDQMVQVGVREWVPMVAGRSVSKLSDLRADRVERLERVAIEGLKQSQGGFLLRIGKEVGVEEILEQCGVGGGVVVVADGSGEGLSELLVKRVMGKVAGSGRVMVLVGPEGGWTEREREMFRGRTEVVRFGGRVMRLETAAVVAGAMMIGAIEQHGD